MQLSWLTDLTGVGRASTSWLVSMFTIELVNVAAIVTPLILKVVAPFGSNICQVPAVYAHKVMGLASTSLDLPFALSTTLVAVVNFNNKHYHET
jgi:hypothetical protein